MMHKTPEGTEYSIEVCSKGATLILFDNGNEPTYVEGFKSIHEVLEYVNDLKSWENWSRRA